MQPAHERLQLDVEPRAVAARPHADGERSDGYARVPDLAGAETRANERHRLRRLEPGPQERLREGRAWRRERRVARLVLVRADLIDRKHEVATVVAQHMLPANRALEHQPAVGPEQQAAAVAVAPLV